MPTYAQYAHQREMQEKKRVQDAILAERHRGFDLSAQDNHSKFERYSFAVVGEGSHASQSAFRRNYDLIDWRSA